MTRLPDPGDRHRLDVPHRRLDLEAELERKHVSGHDATEARAFARFLAAGGDEEAAQEVYGDGLAMGPVMPQRWEGDDS